MRDSTIYNRTNDLRNRINEFLSKLTGNKKQYFDLLTQDQLIDFKTALSDINNVLTLRTTVSFTNWLSDFFELSELETRKLIDQIDKTKPNTNGYDIELTSRINVIAEIKCIIPINKGNYYGAAQRNSILDDAIKLEKGKRIVSDTSNYIKLIGLIDIGKKTDVAIEKLLTPAKNIRTKQNNRLERHRIIEKLVVIDDSTTKLSLNTTNIFIKKIKI